MGGVVEVSEVSVVGGSVEVASDSVGVVVASDSVGVVES